MAEAGTCDTCVHWVCLEVGRGDRFDGFCGLLTDGDVPSDADGGPEGGTFYCGPRFGCVHHVDSRIA